MTDIVSSPPHYTQGKVQYMDAMEAIGIGEEACRAAAIKYLWRLRDKGKALEDARKAQWYVNRLVGQLEKEYAATCPTTSTCSSCDSPTPSSIPVKSPTPSKPPCEPSSCSACDDSNHPFWNHHVASH